MQCALKQEPLVSIVIPTYKSAKTLSSVLTSIKGQTYGNIEVIVVDRSTNDGTRECVEGNGYRYIPIESERSKALNLGAREARGEVLYFIGSDYVLAPEVVEKGVWAIVENGAQAVIVPHVIAPTGFWSRVRWLEKTCYVGDESIEAARFMLRGAFFEAGGFDESMSAYEEHDLHNRLLKTGHVIVRLQGAKENNIGEPNSLSAYAMKYYYYGQTIGRYLKKYRGRSVKQMTPVRPAFIRHRKQFARHPSLTAGFALYQVVRYLSTGVGLVAGRVKEVDRG